MEINEIEILLKKINTKLNEFEKVSKSKGEHFNIFSVMNMEKDEVYTHSAIIGELLNPKGSHGQGKVFLDLFVNLLNENFEDLGLGKFDFLVKEKICERTISKSINRINATGGRIDIIIEDNNQIIIIENKPRAVDQEFQLIRYYNYAKKRNKKFCILYLTMDNKILENEKPYSIKDEKGEIRKIIGYNFSNGQKNEYENLKNTCYDKHTHFCLYYPISFENDVKKWIEKCIEEVNSKPILKEALNQYLNLIKKLTNQTMDADKKKYVIAEIRNNFEASLEISRNFKEAKKEIIKGFWNDLKNYLPKVDIVEKDNCFVTEWEIQINNAKFNDDFTYLLISKNDKAFFYWRYTTINSKELPIIDLHSGIILNPYSNKSVNEIKNARNVKEELELFYLEGYKPGERSIIQKKEDKYNFNSAFFLNKIAKEDKIKGESLNEFAKEIISFVNENEPLYDKILEELK